MERSGGLQTLPEELQYGDDIWKLVVDSSVEEGTEEVVQGVLDRAMQNLMLGKDYKLVSFSDKDAVFSLPAAAEEFGTGTFVGGLLSSGQATVHGVTTSAQQAANGDAKLRAGEMPNDIELQAMGLSEPKARGMMVMYQIARHSVQ